MDRPDPPALSSAQASTQSTTLWPRLGRLWWAVLAFWILLGFLIANQIYLGMLDHGHDWWRLFLWQAGACAAWTPLVPVVLALGQRFRLAFRPVPIAVHLTAAIGLTAVHLLPVAWLGQDVVIYVAILGLGVIIESRERREQAQLRASVLEAELARAELRALRLELQPHFIFNAMNSVVGLLRGGEPERAESMLIGLSDLLRRTLDGRGRQTVPLSEELHLIRLYLDIQTVRFGDRLTIGWSIGDGTESASVPSLLLQPIVENAVRHGIAQRNAPGRIEIQAHRRGDRLHLLVRDDGPGPRAESNLPGQSPEAGHGTGLGNVSSRLEALYGSAWSLNLAEADGGGTEVRIELPWTREPRSREPRSREP